MHVWRQSHSSSRSTVPGRRGNRTVSTMLKPSACLTWGVLLGAVLSYFRNRATHGSDMERVNTESTTTHPSVISEGSARRCMRHRGHVKTPLVRGCFLAHRHRSQYATTFAPSLEGPPRPINICCPLQASIDRRRFGESSRWVEKMPLPALALTSSPSTRSQIACTTPSPLVCSTASRQFTVVDTPYQGHVRQHGLCARHRAVAAALFARAPQLNGTTRNATQPALSSGPHLPGHTPALPLPSPLSADPYT